jgi:beta-xylosidase
MKTFKEFITEARQQTFSSRADLEAHYGGIPKGKTANNAASSGKAKWRLVDTENRKEQARRRKERIANLSSPEERKAADEAVRNVSIC